MTDVEAKKFVAHDWKIEEVTIPKRMTEHTKLGSVAKQYFWVCRNCGSAGGPAPVLPWEDLTVVEPSQSPFLAGTPLIKISNDCQEAKAQIDEFVAMYPVWKEYVDKARAVSWLHKAVDTEGDEFPAVTGGARQQIDKDNPTHCPHCGLPRPKDMNVWQCCSRCGKGVFSGCGPVDE